MTNRISIRSDARKNQRCSLLLNTASNKLHRIAATTQIGIRASAIMWRKPITSVPADGEANLSAGWPQVKKNMSVPNTTAVLRMPTRDTGHIQWFIVPLGVGTRRRAQAAFRLAAALGAAENAYCSSNSPIHRTPQIRTFPSTIHDSHHSVDRTLANFLFRLTVERNGQTDFAQMAWINKRPTTSITAQVTP